MSLGGSGPTEIAPMSIRTGPTLVLPCQASPVGTIVAVSTIRTTAFSGGRVRWTTPFGTTKPCCGERARASLQIDDERAAEHEKELVVFFVLVPMVLALHDAETND